MNNFFDERFVICNNCQYNMDLTCILCGCNIPTKILNPEESCPLQEAKWTALSKKIVPKADVESAPAQVPVLESTAPAQHKHCVPCMAKGR